MALTQMRHVGETARHYHGRSDNSSTEVERFYTANYITMPQSGSYQIVLMS